MRTILVTGSSGFVGSALLAMADGGEVDEKLRFSRLPSSVDLRRSADIKMALSHLPCDAVIHLAAISFVPESFERPNETYEINLNGTIHLVEALKASRFTGAFLYVSSGDVYGAVPAEALPITEDWIPRPRNPYAASKLAAEAYCYQAGLTSGIRFLIARPFNHIGAGQSDRFLLPAMAKQMLEIKQGKRHVIETGNIDVTRDFSDVRDVLRAYLALLEAGRAGETYNVCSGMERNVGEVLREMMAIARVDAAVEVREEKRRPHEQRRHYGSNSKMYRDTGWRPKVPFEQSLRDLLASWKVI